MTDNDDNLKEATDLDLLRTSLVGNPAHGAVGHAVDETSLAEVQEVHLKGSIEELRQEMESIALDPEMYSFSEGEDLAKATHKELGKEGVEEVHNLGKLTLVTFSQEEQTDSELSLSEVLMAKGMTEAETSMFQMLEDTLEYSPEWFCMASLWNVVGQVVAYYGASGDTASLSKVIKTASELSEKHSKHLEDIKKQVSDKLLQQMSKSDSEIEALRAELIETQNSTSLLIEAAITKLKAEIQPLEHEVKTLREEITMSSSILPSQEDKPPYRSPIQLNYTV